jgi:hypothetical protein
MTEPRPSEYLAECFWPGVSEPDLRALDERAEACVRELSRDGEAVRYLGSLLMRADEVVLCRFEGSETAVRSTVERAQIPFERILEAAHSPWPTSEALSGEDRDGSDPAAHLAKSNEAGEGRR